MAREIKFRAWDKKRKCYAKVIQTTNQGWKGYRDKTYITNGIMCFSKWVLSRFIIEQYTDLKDKNGKEIYEGDIVRIMGYGTYEAFWRSWDSSFSLKAIDTDIEEHKILMLCEGWEGDYTIIGNIHENPELLTGSDIDVGSKEER